MNASAIASPAAERRLGRPALVVLLVVLGLGLAWASVDPFTVVFYVPYALVGLLLVYRRPGNAVSWLILAIGFTFLTTTTTSTIDPDGLASGTAPPDHVFQAWLAGWAGSLTFVAYTALTIVFPSGRLPPGRSRWAAIAHLGVALAIAVIPAFATPVRATINGTVPVEFPNPVGLFAASPLVEASPAVVAVLLLIGVGSMLVRYRRATGLDRLQLRWLVATLGFIVVGVVGAFVAIAISGDTVGDFIWFPVIIAYPSLPIAVAVAILRYRLYAIDRIISRTVSWAAVTGILGAGFVLVLLALQQLLAGATQGQTLAVAVSTLAAFALLQPVRSRVQAVVDRRFDRARVDAQRTAERFGERLREEVSLVAVGAELQRTVDSSLRPERVTVWIRER